MTPAEFIKKWKPVALTERAAAQSHFNDICVLLGHPDPISDDPRGEAFAFEKGVTKTGGGEGFADVWKRGFFAWEYKKKKVSLEKALEQLVRYAAALENPPLQVACDTDRFLIRTAWTNAVPEEYKITLDELAEPERLDVLRSVFFDPEKLRPKQTRAGVTKEAADKFSTIALRLQGAGAPEEIAHFVNQLVFCFFANSAELLPKEFLPKLLKRAAQKPDKAQGYFNQLFAAMETGGEFDLTDIAWFNGGLFDGRRALKLDSGDIGLLQAAASLNWSQIDPTIFGTLFERFLEPDKRAQIGAHYTDSEKIMMIVEPVILRPLRQEWDSAKADIEALLSGVAKPPKGTKKRPGMSLAQTAAEEVRARYLERLKQVSVLDPACGSGNFLYLALQGVKDIENRANLECEALGLPPRANEVGPEVLHGIEINPIAAELARTTIWIGEIQWRRRNGIYYDPPPILRKLDTIECRDALITPSPGPGEGGPWRQPGVGRGSESGAPARVNQSFSQGEKVAAEQPDEGVRHPQTPITASAASPHPSPAATPSPHERRARSAAWREATWPAAEFIVGNPPFLGTKKMLSGLGKDYSEVIRSVYSGRVSRFSDLVCWWLEKARAQIVAGKAQSAGLVATNSIRGGQNRAVLDGIERDLRIFEAWSDEPWIVEGAAVRVSVVCFSAPHSRGGLRLNGLPADRINSDLTASSASVTAAAKLPTNSGTAFIGVQKTGPFDVNRQHARLWLQEPLNTNGRPNADVLRPYLNGSDVTRRSSDTWIIDFGATMNEGDAAFYEAPFGYATVVIKPVREKNTERVARDYWWRHWRPRPELTRAATSRTRIIATPRVAKHRLFVWIHPRVLPDSATVAIARDDDTTFGILHSRFHEAWSLRLGTWLGVGNDPRYTPTTTFETFPFPEGLTPNIPAADYAADPRAQAIAKAASRLDELRNAWLNPPDLVCIEPEVYPTPEQRAAGAENIYPDRILPKDAAAAAKLRERTLTKLYNQRPQWLADAHRDLDAAVAAAYGWPADISEEDALGKLLELNLERVRRQDKAPALSPGRERVAPDLRQGSGEGESREASAGLAAEEMPPGPMIGREQFARISEVEGIPFTDEMARMFEDFDSQDLSPEERRRAIIERFKREAAE